MRSDKTGTIDPYWEMELRSKDALWDVTSKCAACDEEWRFPFDRRDPEEPKKTLNEDGRLCEDGAWVCPWCIAKHGAVARIISNALIFST